MCADYWAFPSGKPWTGSNLFASVPNLEITMKTLILAAIRCSLIFLVAIGVAISIQATPSSARTIGMVADDDTASVTVFDADTDTVLGTVSITSVLGGAIGDVLITPDQSRGFVTNFNSEVFVIDLTTSPPSLAGGTNPIPISNYGEDLSISPNGRFLVVSDGSAFQPISVIDIAAQVEISTLSVGSDTNSVDVCSDGSVLATSSIYGTVRRLTISGTGTLTDTGEVLVAGGDEPNNVFCAPSGNTGIVITRDADKIRSFRIPGLGLVHTRALSGDFGISGLVNSAGDRAFTRDNGGFVDVFSYNSTTGALGAVPVLSIPITDTLTFYGMDQMALTPEGNKLYVSQPNALNVYDASTGALLTRITDPNIVSPTGVFLSGPASPTPTPTATPPRPITVTFNTNPAGLFYRVDGTTYNSAHVFSWPSGSSHTISTTSPQRGSSGVRYVWQSWSDNGARSHTIAPTTSTPYTATFTTQYYLTMNAGTGGTVMPASGWRNKGAQVTIRATPSNGYHFTGWTGSGNGSYSGPNNPASVTMNAPITETASFSQ
jgi:Divergent InlB B-repeat domain